MKRSLKIIGIVLFAGFFFAQFYRPDRTNPQIVAAEALEATTEISDDVKRILDRSCNDCHSNATVYPWYSNISPFSWMLIEHVEEGRRELNFSVWRNYSAKKKRHKYEEICEQVTIDEMPHKQYLWLHRDAQLSPEDKQILCGWARAEKTKLKDEE